MSDSLFDSSYRGLLTADPLAKVAAVRALWRAWQAGELRAESGEPVQPIGPPGRPDRPRRVPPKQVPNRRLTTSEGRSALVHAVAHIEFNAINLALDAVYRFRGLPRDYYHDWLRVAVEEAGHFTLLAERLDALGHGYGDFDAHDGLWSMATATADNPLTRMALVPRVLEARGLDVTPGMIARLEQVGDKQTVAILEIILREEVGHVAAGSRWFRHCCAQVGLSPEETFLQLIRTHYRDRLRGPFNETARLAGGFTAAELARLRELSSEG